MRAVAKGNLVDLDHRCHVGQYTFLLYRDEQEQEERAADHRRYDADRQLGGSHDHPGHRIGQDEEHRPGETAEGQKLAMVRPEQEPHRVGHDQADEPDEPAEADGHGGDERRDREGRELDSLDRDADAPGVLVADADDIELRAQEEQGDRSPATMQPPPTQRTRKSSSVMLPMSQKMVA